MTDTIRPRASNIYHKVTAAKTRQWRYVLSIRNDGVRYRPIYPHRKSIGPTRKCSLEAWAKWADDGDSKARIDNRYLIKVQEIEVDVEA